jgi:hypothetical protein
MADAIVAHLYGLSEDQFRWILRNCDFPKEQLGDTAFRARLPAKGFWRTGVGSAEHPWRQAWKCESEFRLPNLALVAFVELARLRHSFKGDLAMAISAFAPISGNGGWQLPDQIRLSDYGLGRTAREAEKQPLRTLLCREFSNEEPDQQSWESCQRIARDLRILWGREVPVETTPASDGSGRGRPQRLALAPEQTRLFGMDE